MHPFMSTLQLGISLLCLVIIVWLFLHYSKNFKDGNNKQHKDILYISGYGVLIILELIVYVCLGNVEHDNIVDTIAFGATLSSLIMSVVAIIFTIVSGKDGREQLGKITQATNELKETAKSLTEFNAIAIALSDRITEIDAKLGIIKEETTQIHKNFDNRLASEMREKSSYNTQNGVDVELFINGGSIFGAQILLICSLSYFTKKKVDFALLPEGFVQDYCYGYLIASAAIGIIDLSGEWPNITVEHINSRVMEQCKAFLIDAIKTRSNSKGKESLLIVVNEILKAYDQQEITDEDLK